MFCPGVSFLKVSLEYMPSLLEGGTNQRFEYFAPIWATLHKKDMLKLQKTFLHKSICILDVAALVKCVTAQVYLQSKHK